MSKLCKFTWGNGSFLLDPDFIVEVREDTEDDTCRLVFRDGETQWVNGKIDDIMASINNGRTQ